MLPRSVGGPVEHDHHVLGVVLHIPPRPGHRPEPEPFVEAVLAVRRARGPDHRLRPQVTGGGDRHRVEVDAQAQLACAVLNHQSAVLKRFCHPQPLLQQQELELLRPQERPRLEQWAGLRRRQPHIPHRRTARPVPGNEVPGPEVQVLLIHVLLGIAELRSPTAIEQDPGPEPTDLPHQLDRTRLLTPNLERCNTPGRLGAHPIGLH